MQTTLGVFNVRGLVCWTRAHICNTEGLIKMINVFLSEFKSLVCGEDI